MKYSVYSDNKNVNCMWISLLPTGWSLARLKNLGETITGGTPKTDNLDYWENGSIPWLPSGKVQNCSLNLEDADTFITEDALKNSAAKLIKPNSVLVALTGATCGNIGLLNFESTANQSVVALVPNLLAHSKYIFYSLLAQREQIIVKKSGGAQGGIATDDVRNLVVALPPKLEDQINISEFLDRETAKIDELIQKQERLIELLNEEIKSITSNLLVCGLNPNDELIDSGVDWLGRIPKHWKVKKFKFCAALIQDKTAEKTNVVALENIESWTGNLIETDSKYEGDGISFEEGDVLFGKLRPYLAKVFLAENHGEAFGDILVFRANDDLSPGYLFRTILNNEFIKLVNSSTYGTKMPRANWDFIGNIKIAVPPLEEQIKIVNIINSKILIFEKLTAKAKHSIGLLKEHRASLISATVTGQVDVRELV